jgi:hypothetical protein
MTAWWLPTVFCAAAFVAMIAEYGNLVSRIH